MIRRATVTVLDHVRSLLAEMELRYQQRFDSQNKAFDAALFAAGKAASTALMAAEKAVSKAEFAAEKRFDSVNEFRAAYQDVISQQMPRSEAEQRLKHVSAEIDELKKNDQARMGRTTGANTLWGYSIGAVGMVAAVIAIIVALK